MKKPNAIFLVVIAFCAISPATFTSCSVCDGIYLADLLISDLISPTHPQKNETITLDVGDRLDFKTTISNSKDRERGKDCDTQTAIASSMKLLVKWFDNSQSASSDTLYHTGPIDAGKNSEVSSGVTFMVPGEYELTNSADANDVVKERNEDNNVAVVFEILNWILDVIDGGRTTHQQDLHRIRVIDRHVDPAGLAKYKILVATGRIVRFH